MARIIYKEGLEGQNRLESIEGIEIDLLNGQKALIYPKYAKKVMLPEDKMASWDAKETSEIKALKKEDNISATGALLKCGSPAAEYVSNFSSDKYGIFGLPTLLAAKEIKDQMKYINECARYIDGADLLESGMDLSSCFRSDKNGIWSSSCEEYIDLSNTCIPTILYRKA